MNALTDTERTLLDALAEAQRQRDEARRRCEGFKGYVEKDWLNPVQAQELRAEVERLEGQLSDCRDLSHRVVSLTADVERLTEERDAERACRDRWKAEADKAMGHLDIGYQNPSAAHGEIAKALSHLRSVAR